MMIRVLAAMMLWPSFHGCENYVLFTEPQPVGAETLESFPEEWQGCYRLQKDSAYVEIVPEGFTVTKAMRMVAEEQDLFPDTADDPLSALLKHRILEGLQDTLVTVEDGVMHVRYEPVQRMLTVDLMEGRQRVGKDFILRRVGDLLCLSAREDSFSDPAYQVDVWERGKGNITTHILLAQSLGAINKVVDLPGDTLSGPLTVTRKQFMRLLRKGAYQEGDVLIPCAWCASSLVPH